MLWETNPERRVEPEVAVGAAAGLESALGGGDGAAAMVAISEEDTTDPQDEQKRLSSATSLAHDGHLIRVFSKEGLRTPHKDTRN
jgi:hypothetical protein